MSLTKLGKSYNSKQKLEDTCERMLAFSSSPSIRTITTLLKNSRNTEKPTAAAETDSSNKYGTTHCTAYWKKGGGGNVE